jgi:hypothetical protein
MHSRDQVLTLIAHLKLVEWAKYGKKSQICTKVGRLGSFAGLIVALGYPVDWSKELNSIYVR